MDMKDQVAIVTGGARGIGKGICLVLAELGAHVVAADIEIEGAKKTAAEMTAKGYQATAVAVDTTKKDSAERMAKDVVDSLGRIDILVNAAGVVAAPGWEDSPLSRVEDWDAAYEVNVKGVVLPSIAVAQYMKERRSGKIVNIASAAGRLGSPGFPHYSASKAAVINWTQAHAMELGPYNINVNAVCPGLVWTPMWELIASRTIRQNPKMKDLSPREVFERVFQGANPLSREQTPEDIGWAVAFFASERSRNITGQSLNVNGGNKMN